MHEKARPPLLSRYKFTLISLMVILLVAIPLVMLGQKHTSPTPTPTPTPAAVVTPKPLTPQSADTKLQTLDTQLQQTLNQVDSNIQAAEKVDTTQDSTQGL